LIPFLPHAQAALKIIAKSEKNTELVLQECSLLLALHHPHVVYLKVQCILMHPPPSEKFGSTFSSMAAALLKASIRSFKINANSTRRSAVGAVGHMEESSARPTPPP
jgi:hypothetical protein